MSQNKTKEENKSLPIKNWNEVVNGKINVPDELDTIVNKVGMQINFMLYSGKSKEETICDIVAGCQDYFTQYRNLPNEPSIDVFERVLRNEIHKNLFILDISVTDKPDLVIRGVDDLVKVMVDYFKMYKPEPSIQDEGLEKDS